MSHHFNLFYRCQNRCNYQTFFMHSLIITASLFTLSICTNIYITTNLIGQLTVLYKLLLFSDRFITFIFQLYQHHLKNTCYFFLLFLINFSSVYTLFYFYVFLFLIIFSVHLHFKSTNPQFCYNSSAFPYFSNLSLPCSGNSFSTHRLNPQI